MLKYTKFAIVASFFCLWLNSFFLESTQILIAFSFIFTFGILHGANDLILIENTTAATKRVSFKKNLLHYIIVVVLGLLLFYVLPVLALLLFIIVSAFHFGDQQGLYFDLEAPNIIRSSYPFVYGILILFLLFFFHQSEVESIINAIIRNSFTNYYIEEVLMLSGFLFLSMSAFFYWKFESLRNRLLTEVFFLLVFAIIFKTSSLLWGFAIYFIIWHSIPSILDQITFIYGSVTIPNIKSYCINGFAYWLASILGIALLYFLFRDQEIFNALFFSFLAAITFPHVLVILKMMHKNKKEISQS